MTQENRASVRRARRSGRSDTARIGWTLVACCSLAGCGPAPGGSPSRPPAKPDVAGSVSGGDPVEIGRRIYLGGINQDGAPIAATVSGDVLADGRNLRCSACHLRCGMGSQEGGVTSPTITARALGQETRSGSRVRPPYDDLQLARAIVEGIDSAGARLSPLMPRYHLSASESAALVAFLRTLGKQPDEGVSDRELHLATVVSSDEASAAMLEVLRAFVRARNDELKNPKGRRQSGAFFMRDMDSAYRTWVLHEWRIDGDSATWKDQLEAHYRRQPVFALLSGTARGEWKPIHELCEAHHLPCILPNTDFPPAEDGDFYTVYFSRGTSTEARTIAEHILAANRIEAQSILQVFAPGTDGGAQALLAALSRPGAPALPIEELRLENLESAELERVAERIHAARCNATVLWLPGPALERLEPAILALDRTRRVYVSATLSGGTESSTLGAALWQRVHLAQPFSSQDLEPAGTRLRLWLDANGLARHERRIQAQSYFACVVLAEALMHIKYDNFYRDYLLELLDHASGIAAQSAAYPGLAFGQGQRALASGCFLHVPRAQGGPREDWVVPQ